MGMEKGVTVGEGIKEEREREREKMNRYVELNPTQREGSFPCKWAGDSHAC